jgi:hypothetical protein
MKLFVLFRLLELGQSAEHLGQQFIERPLLTAPGDCEDGKVGGMKRFLAGETEVLGEKPAPTPLCPAQIPLARPRARTRAAAVESEQLTASAMARTIKREVQVEIIKCLCLYLN